MVSINNNEKERGLIHMNYEEAYQLLKKYRQEHVLNYYQELSAQEQKMLLDQIASTDFDVIQLIEQKNSISKGVISPLAAMQLDEIEAHKKEFRQIGVKAIENGKVGAVLLAGGMGTRLGSDQPKGMYSIGITKEVYIFERIIRNLLDVVEDTGSWIHLFIMTSDKNDQMTQTFLKEKNYFGYDPSYVTFFIQEMSPATNYNGRIYMEEKWKMSTSPNGNGGWFASMERCGVLKLVEQEGIEWLNVFAVDNVLQRIADPVFIGATIARQCAVGAKVVKKAAPDEKVGIICLEDGRPSIVEYYELTKELMEAVDEKGEPAYNFGVILNYLFRVEELMQIVKKCMPLHIVEKKIPFLDQNGVLIRPIRPNGYKFETLVLDMIHLAKNCLPFEVVRNKEFAPIKNRTGIDSVESAQALLKENGIEL